MRDCSSGPVPLSLADGAGWLECNAAILNTSQVDVRMDNLPLPLERFLENNCSRRGWAGQEHEWLQQTMEISISLMQRPTCKQRLSSHRWTNK